MPTEGFHWGSPNVTVCGPSLWVVCILQRRILQFPVGRVWAGCELSQAGSREKLGKLTAYCVVFPFILPIPMRYLIVPTSRTSLAQFLQKNIPSSPTRIQVKESPTCQVGRGWKSYTCVCVKSLSHVQLFVTLWTVAHQAPLSIGFFRQEYWSGLPWPPPGDLPNPGIEPTSPVALALAGRFFTTSAIWEALLYTLGLPIQTYTLLLHPLPHLCLLTVPSYPWASQDFIRGPLSS